MALFPSFHLTDKLSLNHWQVPLPVQPSYLVANLALQRVDGSTDANQVRMQLPALPCGMSGEASRPQARADQCTDTRLSTTDLDRLRRLRFQ
jgi:hypothetical protein